jgi:hypothetical protein
VISDELAINVQRFVETVKNWGKRASAAHHSLPNMRRILPHEIAPTAPNLLK